MNARQAHDDGHLCGVVTIETAVRLIAGDLERMTESELVQLLLRTRSDRSSMLVSRVEPLVRGELARRRTPVEAPTTVPQDAIHSISTWRG